MGVRHDLSQSSPPTEFCASFETAASRPPQDDEYFYVALKAYRHPEEHPGGVRLEGRTIPVPPAARPEGGLG